MKKIGLKESVNRLLEKNSLQVDLDAEDKQFDEILNQFLIETNSKQAKDTTLRAHGWYYQDVVYSDGRKGVFCYNPLQDICDASVENQFMDKNKRGFTLSELIQKVNKYLQYS